MAVYHDELEFIEEADFNSRLWPISYSREQGFWYLFPAVKKDNKRTIQPHIGFGYIAHPMTGCDESTVSKLTALLSLQYPKDSILHTMMYASPDIVRYLQRMMVMRSRTPEESTLGAMTQAEIEFLKSGTQKAISRRVKALVRDFVVITTFKMPIAHGKPTADEISQLNDLKIGVGQMLETIGVLPTPLDPNLYLRFMGTLMNWGDDAFWRTNLDSQMWDENVLIRDQVLDPSVSVGVAEKGLRFGKKHVRWLTPRKLPQYHSLGLMPSFIGDPNGNRGIPGNFAMSLIVRFMDDGEARPQLTAQRNIVNYQAFGPMLKWAPQLAARKNSFDVLFKQLDKGERAVQIYPAFCFFADSEEEMTAAVSNACAYFQELNWVMQHETGIQLVTHLNHLPFNADLAAQKFLGRYGTVSTSQAAEFFPIIGDWKGTGTPTLTLLSRNNQIMSIDAFDSNTNFNVVMAASSGSGKSFAMNQIICSYLATGMAQFWIIDVGYSYKNLCEELGGVFLEFSDRDDDQTCLNPFKMIRDFNEDGEMVIGVLVSMAQENEPLSDVQLTTLRNVLTELWFQYGEETTVTLVADVLKESTDERIADVGARLWPFTMSGPYGRYFHGTPNVSFGGEFTVCELDHLKAKPALQRVVLLMIAFQVSNEMYFGGLEKKKILCIDEAWSLLQHPSVATFIEGLYRKARKTNGSAFVITQQLSDLYKSPSGEAIAGNSACKLLLSQPSEVITSLQREQRLEIGEWGFNTLRTVHTSKGEFSEIFVYTSNFGMGVGRLIVNRFAQLLFSTDPMDRTAIKRRTAGGMTVAEGIRDIIALEQQHGRRHKDIDLAA